MKNTDRTRKLNAVERVMSEYIEWGGPIVTRAAAVADMQSRGFDARAIDYSVFMRRAVAAPADPEAHLAFLRDIQAMELARQAA